MRQPLTWCYHLHASKYGFMVHDTSVQGFPKSFNTMKCRDVQVRHRYIWHRYSYHITDVFVTADLHDDHFISAQYSVPYYGQRGAASLQTTDWLCAERNRPTQITGTHLHFTWVHFLLGCTFADSEVCSINFCLIFT